MSEKYWQMLDPHGGSVRVFNAVPVVIGRGDECDVKLDNDSVSSFHVRVNQDGQKLLLQDLGSKNGTFVDGKQIKTVKITPVAGEESVALQIAELHFTLFYGEATGVQAKAAQVPPALPESSAAEQWFYCHAGHQFGPLTAGQMFDVVDQGLLQPTDDVWRPDMPGGMKAFEVAGLFTSAPDVGAGGATTISDPLNRERVTCPYCWHRFSPEEVLYIANHPDLRDDRPVLSDNDFQRFLPSRFTPEGLALDAGGVICPDMACPRCHLRIPAALLNMPPLFISIVGAPSSGKSYLLASMSWKLRTTLPELFAMRYMDVDATTNHWLNDYEEKLFLQADEKAWQTIEKTHQDSQTLYRQVTMNGMTVFLPLPCMFTLQAEHGKLEGIGETNTQRTLILYDNAGENFNPGADSSVNPGTRHLIHAEGLLFLFDPTKDPNFRRAVHSEDLQLQRAELAQRQDNLVVEMVDRIRKYLGLKGGVQYTKPIIIAISKADVLRELIQLDESPWVWNAATQTHALNLSKIAEISFIARTIMLKYAPQVVQAAESFSNHVVYLPNSALGHSPSSIDGGKPPFYVRPADVKPQWAEVPVLYFLARLGLIPSIRQDDPAALRPAKCDRAGQIWRVRVTEQDEVLEVPVFYSGHTLLCPTTRRRFRVPQLTTEAATL